MMDEIDTEETTRQTPEEPLTAERVKELWSRTYNTEGKPDWSHIFPLYDESIVFQDCIQRQEGKKNFIALCNRLTKRCRELQMHLDAVVRDGPYIYFQWKMVMKFRRAPSTPVYGCSKLTLNEHDLIVEQRDYYDLWGDIYNGIPVLNKLYRAFMLKVFG